MKTHRSYCRICTAYCGIEVDVEDGAVTAVRGDREDPLSGGYSCSKGRQLPYQQSGSARLKSSLRRNSNGGFDPIETEAALDEIAEKLQQIVDRDGPRAVATFSGTATYANSAALPVIQAWHEGIGSPSRYSTLTIDQPAKIVAAIRHGVWGAGPHPFGDADVILTIGNNPIVSGLTLPGGPPGTNPTKSLADARRRGMKMICVDPRRSETAKQADIHLQIRPGEDPTLLAGMIRVMLRDNRHDRDFCDAHTEGLDVLRRAVEPFDPEYVERRAGVPAEQVVAAARLFADGPRGSASSGTGPDMSPRPCLAEHLISCINTLCGRHLREGEPLPNPGVLAPPLPRPAQVIPRELLPPELRYGEGPKSRFRELHQMYQEMPATTLAEEILEPGDGQIRALIIVGGNPAVSMPDPKNMVRAMNSLELCVSADIQNTESTRRSHYVLAARHSLEREDVTEFMDRFYEVPYSHYTEAVAPAPEETLEEWEIFVGLAKRMGTRLALAGGEIQPAQPPDKFGVLELIRPSTRIRLSTIREKSGGHVFDELAELASPPLPGIHARFQMAPDTVEEELAAVFAETVPAEAGDRFDHLLVCRRIREVSNSVGQDFPLSRKKQITNLAYLNPETLNALGAESGDLMEIESRHDTIHGVANASEDIRLGVVSMAHCFGADVEGHPDARTDGSNTGRLVRTDRNYDSITGMARQSAIPVAIRRVPKLPQA